MAMKPVVLTAMGRDSFSSDQLERLDDLGADVVACPGSLTEEEMIETVRPYEVVATTRRPVSHFHASTLRRLPRLQALVVHTTGTHWIDEGYLAQQNVRLLSLAGYATESVAEQAMAGLLMMSRRTHLSNDRSRGLISDAVSLRGFELRGRVIGLIGYGRIGQRIHELLSPFGVEVLINDPTCIGSVPTATILDRADILVLACSTDYRRPPIVDRALLGRCRARYIINAACDELVDHHAIVEAIQQRRLDGYVLDEVDDTLTRADVEPGRIVQTMHTGWYADESMARGKAEWVELIEAAVTRRCAGAGVGVDSFSDRPVPEVALSPAADELLVAA